MNLNRLEERKTAFLKAVTRLEEACAQAFSPFIRDAVLWRAND
jgi:hypothetical protein